MVIIKCNDRGKKRKAEDGVRMTVDRKLLYSGSLKSGNSIVSSIEILIGERHDPTFSSGFRLSFAASRAYAQGVKAAKADYGENKCHNTPMA
jgi:hypothetical protein